MSLLDTASLIVTPNGYKEGKLYSVIPSDGSGDLSVTRATTATRVNSQGLVELVPYNLLSYSEDLTNAAWTSINTTEVIGATAPDGTATAWTLSKSAANGRLYQVPASTDGSMVASVYAKAGTLNQVAIEMNTSYRVLDLSTGTLVSGGSGSYNIEDVGNGWYRFSVVDSSYSGVAIWANPASSTSGNILIWHPQVEAGTTATTYQKTETRLNIPRLDYSNGTCPSILVEPQRTNLFTYSSSFDDSSWIKFNTTITANNTTSPSGIQDADKLVEGSSTSDFGVYKLTPSAAGANAPIIITCYAKSDGRNVLLKNSYLSDASLFDLQNGTVIYNVGSGVGEIEDAGNGWYRCTLKTTTNGSGNVGLTFYLSDLSNNTVYTGNGTSGAYIWGAQLEAGSYATSYIPTTSASVTRNADVISKTGISSLIGQTEGTIFCELDRIDGAENMGIWMRTGGTAYNEMIAILINPDGTSVASIRSSSANQFVASSSSVGLGKHKFALAYKANDFAFYIDGVQIATSTSGTPPTCDQVYLGGYPDGGARASKNVATALWKTRLTNTQLAQLTTI